MRSGWCASPLKDRVNLEPNEVHVWTVELDTPAGTASGGGELLSPDERQRVAASASGVQARRFAAGRGALRRILAGYLGADPRRLEFAYGPFGKPGLASRDGCHLEFSVAHTGGVGQVAVRRDRPIGIDLEAVRPVDAVVIARRFLSDADADWVARLPAARQVEGFLRLWAIKESYVKFTGRGLTVPLRDIDVLGLCSGAAEQGWAVLLLDPGPGLLGALVTASPVIALRPRSFVLSGR